MCPGWWVGRGCLLGVLLLLLLLLAGGAPAPAAPSTTPGASGAPPFRSKAPPQHQQHSAGGVPWVPRARRPPSTSEPETVTPAAPLFPGTQVLPPLDPSPTGPPGVTASDQSLMIRNTRSTATNNTKNFRHHHKYRQQLYNDNARCVLKLCTNGTVQATSNLSDPHTLLYLRPIDGGRYIEIRSEATGLFLCMNRRGNLYASCNRSSECEFMKTIEDNFYDTLQSRQFHGRYIAIAVNGRVKRARRVRGPLGTEHYFLPRKVDLENVRKIIRQYQQALGPTPSQRCDGHNEYNMTGGSGAHDARAREEGAISTTPPQGSTATTRFTLPPATTTTTTTTPATAKPKTPHRKCRIDKRRKKCRRRHRKRCKNKSKKCRERRRRRKKDGKKEKESSSSSDRRRAREQDGERVATTTEGPSMMVESTPTAAGREGNRAGTVQSQPRYRHGGKASRTHQRGARHRKPAPVVRRLRHYRLSTPSPASSPVSLTPFSAHKPTRSSAHPWVVTLTPSQPFPPAPSSAPPHHVRHAHSGRRRRPRGPLTPPTSTTA